MTQNRGGGAESFNQREAPVRHPPVSRTDARDWTLIYAVLVTWSPHPPRAKKDSLRAKGKSLQLWGRDTMKMLPCV